MTCIVALAHEGSVYMGCDSVGFETGTYFCMQRADPKIYINGPFMIGFTSSFRMGQLLGYSLVVPPQSVDMSVDKYINTVFIDAVRTCLKEGGVSTKEYDGEHGGTFLVSYRNRIFQVYDDYAVGESIFPFNACGGGTAQAVGSLYSTREYMRDNPRGRIHLALECAAQFSVSVRGPFLVLRHEHNTGDADAQSH